jgi:hypothetical protein
MFRFITIVLPVLNLSKDNILETGELLWDKIYSFFTMNIWTPIKDYRFIAFGIIIILIICIIIIWARKHVPSRGRIIDRYDAMGEKQENKRKKDKGNEIHDLPKEFYKRK